jgi:heme A synthase
MPLMRVCSWESSQPPKLTDRVRILALVLFANVAEQIGAGFVNRMMLVQIQSLALHLDGVTDRTGLS